MRREDSVVAADCSIANPLAVLASGGCSEYPVLGIAKPNLDQMYIDFSRNRLNCRLRGVENPEAIRAG